jgi:predicted AlkP superfamily pyrophosphatase or phosphodiesterase
MRPDAKIIFDFQPVFATLIQTMKLCRPFLPVLAILLGLWLAACSTPATTSSSTGPVILISIDGFRWDYLAKYPAPTLRQLASNGVHATRMTPCFPSKTFPNHYTLVTGLRPEHHGIVSNYFFDPALNESFNKGRLADNADPRWWSEGEPVWITAEKQNLRTACFYWPGSQAAVQGRQPSYHKAYKGNIVSNDNVDDLLKQLDQPGDLRPKFCAIYFDIVDRTGHKFGPDAPETGEAVREADTAIARLLDGLSKRGLRDTANLVIVSDHGMTPIDSKRVIFLEDMMPISTVQVESYGPNGGVRPKTGSAAELVAQIRAKNIPHLQVYLREEVPERFHYRDNPRIPPVVLMADEGWNIETKLGWPKLAPNYDHGSHGYDPSLPNMGALFIASGPAFKKHVEIPDVENIHVYNMLCAVLGLKPALNDGDQRLVDAALTR